MDNSRKALTIDNILGASFGEISSELRATFKKTVLIKQYETEVMEAEAVLKLEKPLTGAERMIVSSILQVQLEYTAYCNLLFKGLVTQKEFEERKNELISSVEAIRTKSEAVTGKNMDEYFGFVNMQ